MNYPEDDLLNISGIQHFVFCRRQWALIHIEQQWEENFLTASGEWMHEKAHDPLLSEKRGDLILSRNMPVLSYHLGISGICDVVEFHKAEDGVVIYGHNDTYSIIPVEYKYGEPKEEDYDVLQVAAQALCLEDMFCTTIKELHLFYGRTKHRLKVPFDDSIRERVSCILQEMHELYARRYTPKVKTSKKCRSCSLSGICVPKLNQSPSVANYINQNLKDEECEKFT